VSPGFQHPAFRRSCPSAKKGKPDVHSRSQQGWRAAAPCRRIRGLMSTFTGRAPFPEGARVIGGQFTLRDYTRAAGSQGANAVLRVVHTEDEERRSSANSALWELSCEDLRRLWGLAAQRWNDADAIIAFFNSPHRAFSGEVPIALAAGSPEGLEAVQAMLMRMVYGTRMRRSLLEGFRRGFSVSGNA
jgi:hypothetical protein